MISRKRTFLETEEWRNIPWAKYPEERLTPYHQLLDITSFVPGYLEDAITLRNDAKQAGDVSAQCESLVSRLIESVRQLIRWRYHWESTNEKVAWEVPLHPKYNSTVDKDCQPLFSSLFHFQSLQKAKEIVQYNATLMCMTGLLTNLAGKRIISQQMADLFTECPNSTNPLSLPSDQMDVITMAHEVCRCVEYLLQSDHASLGSFYILLPLRTR